MINKRRRWSVRISFALTALFIFTAAGCFLGSGSGTPNPNPGPGAGIVFGCCTEGPPPGSVKTDSTWSPTKCGNPTDSSVKNYCTYENYSDRPLGATMDICNDQKIPAGWTADESAGPGGTYWSPTKCGSPASNTPNMLKIKRVS